MLEGIKVIEYATYMAAPGAGSILSDWGADVVKVEDGRADREAALHVERGAHDGLEVRARRG